MLTSTFRQWILSMLKCCGFLCLGRWISYILWISWISIFSRRRFWVDFVDFVDFDFFFSQTVQQSRQTSIELVGATKNTGSSIQYHLQIVCYSFWRCSKHSITVINPVACLTNLHTNAWTKGGAADSASSARRTRRSSLHWRPKRVDWDSNRQKWWHLTNMVAAGDSSISPELQGGQIAIKLRESTVHY